MAIYRKRTARATRKKVASKTKRRKPAPSVVKKRKKTVPPVKRRKKKVRAGKPTAKKRASRVLKKPVRRVRKVAKKPVRRVTKKSLKKAVPSRRQKIAREKKRVVKQIAKVSAAEQRARKTKRRSPRRTKIKRRKKEIAEQRIERQLVIQELPRKTPKERKLSREREAARQRANFRRLFRLARERGELPAKRREPRRIESRRNVGRRRVVRIDQMISDATVEDILYQCEQAGRELRNYDDQYAVWSSTTCYSALGEELVGSNTKLLGGTDPDARFFQTEGFDSTGDFGSGVNDYQKMMAALRDHLEDVAGRPRTLVYLHWVELRNFTRRG